MKIMARGKEKSTWFYVAIGGVAASILSLFLPIVGCSMCSFNIVDLFVNSWAFQTYIIDAYHSERAMPVTFGTIIWFALIAIAALICALIGLVTLRAQHPNTKNFVLTIVGLVGILIPSVFIIVCVVCLQDHYDYGLTIGIAPIISPIAILIAISAVIRRKNKVAEELRREVEARGLIHRAGDL